MDLQTYNFLRHLLRDRGRVRLIEGRHQFLGGFVPTHRSCHLTAMQVAIELGFAPVLGVLFLDHKGKLSPWSHVVNRGPICQLIDFSPQVDETKLGFVEVDWSEFAQWRAVLGAYHAVTEDGRLSGPDGGSLLTERSANSVPDQPTQVNVSRTQSNGVLISGPTHSVLLFSQ